MIPRLAADWILPFIRTDSNRDFDSIMILPLSLAIEIEIENDGGDFATLAYRRRFPLKGPSSGTTDFAPDSIAFSASLLRRLIPCLAPPMERFMARYPLSLDQLLCNFMIRYRSAADS